MLMSASITVFSKKRDFLSISFTQNKKTWLQPQEPDVEK